MRSHLGVMQGRLLPKYQGRYQAHPVGYWQDEFFIAQKLGLYCIEFILDYNNADDNPLLKDEGISNIKALSVETGIAVKSICADYFMEAPLHSEEANIAKESQQMMTRLLNSASKLAVTDIVIPCVDQSSLKNPVAVNRFVKMLTPLVEIAEQKGINFSLETDLAPQPFVELLDCFNSERVTVNYDIGNSAALGYNPVEELDAYGNKITDIHIKDRIIGGGPVILGEGDANFTEIFNKLKQIGYQSLFIMQAYRDEYGIDIFNTQLKWITPFLEEF